MVNQDEIIKLFGNKSCQGSSLWFLLKQQASSTTLVSCASLNQIFAATIFWKYLIFSFNIKSSVISNVSRQ